MTDKLVDLSVRLSRFIDSLRMITNDWEDLCDCDAVANGGHHEEGCVTLNVRKDEAALQETRL